MRVKLSASCWEAAQTLLGVSALLQDMSTITVEGGKSILLPNNFPSCCADLGQIYGAAVPWRFWKQVCDRKNTGFNPQTGRGWKAFTSEGIKYTIWKSEIDMFVLRKWSVCDQSNIWHGACPGLMKGKSSSCTNTVESWTWRKYQHFFKLQLKSGI